MFTPVQLETLRVHDEYLGLAAAVRKIRADAKKDDDFKPSYNAALHAKRNGFKFQGYKKRATAAAIPARRKLINKLHAKVSTKGDRKWKTYSTATQLSMALKTLHNMEVPLATVRRDLRALGKKCRVRAQVPSRRRKDIDQQRSFRARVRRQGISSEDVIFSDEVIISCKENTGRYQWVDIKKKEEPYNREAKSRRNYPSYHLWAAVGVGYKSKLVIIPRKVIGDDGPEAYNLNAAGYRRRCLSQVSGHMAANPQKYFLQDGARPHTAKTTAAYMEKKKWKVLQNPPYTPQWNMIELIWKELHARIGQLCPMTADELEQAAQAAWAEMDDFIDRICRQWRSIMNKSKL